MNTGFAKGREEVRQRAEHMARDAIAAEPRSLRNYFLLDSLLQARQDANNASRVIDERRGKMQEALTALRAMGSATRGREREASLFYRAQGWHRVGAWFASRAVEASGGEIRLIQRGLMAEGVDPATATASAMHLLFTDPEGHRTQELMKTGTGLDPAPAAMEERIYTNIDFGQAVYALTQSTVIMPWSARAHIDLACLLLVRQESAAVIRANNDKARRALETALKLKPNDERAGTLLRTLDSLSSIDGVNGEEHRDGQHASTAGSGGVTYGVRTGLWPSGGFG